MFITVYVMLAEWFEFRALLMALKTQGLLDTGEYVVVGVDPNQYDSSDTQKYITGQRRHYTRTLCMIS